LVQNVSNNSHNGAPVNVSWWLFGGDPVV
jgi:hypothetical protein